MGDISVGKYFFRKDALEITGESVTNEVVFTCTDESPVDIATLDRDQVVMLQKWLNQFTHYYPEGGE